MQLFSEEFSPDLPDPKFTFPKNLLAEKLINKRLLYELADIKKCGGNCEFLTSGDYLQLTIRNECDKFSFYDYLLFDLRSGSKTYAVELFRPEKRKDLLQRISKITLENYSKFNDDHCTVYIKKPIIIGWKDFEIVLSTEGILFQYNFDFAYTQMDCDRGAAFLKWNELKEYLYP